MKKPVRKVSPTIFGLTLICFFLPFVTLSCQERPIATLTGVELAKGTSILPPGGTRNNSQEKKIPAEPLATLAFISSVVGLGTSLKKAKKSAIVPAGSGAAGMILLLMLKSKMDNEILKQGQGLILTSYGLGFWLAFLLFVCATLVNVYTLVQEKDVN